MAGFVNMLMELGAFLLGDRWLSRRNADAERRVQELSRQLSEMPPPVQEPTAIENPAAPPNKAAPASAEEKFKSFVKTDRTRNK